VWPKVSRQVSDDTEFVSWYLEDIRCCDIGNFKHFHDIGEISYSHPLPRGPEHGATRNKVLCEVYVALTDLLYRGSCRDMQNCYKIDDMDRVSVIGLCQINPYPANVENRVST
jgi:hypothetical protein